MKMNLLKTVVISAVLFLQFGCGNKEQDQSSKGLYFFTNMDQYYGFVDPNRIKKVNFARSGEYVSYSDSGEQSSLTFYRLVSEISDKKLYKAEVSGWLYSELQNPECFFIYSADSAYTKVYDFQSTSVKNDLSSVKQWTKVSATFYIPDTVPPYAQLRIYMGNQSHKTVYIDDFAIQFFEKK
ncbi:MAG: hypothetical protein ABI723_03920 [Bacteroidia bacterium]